MRPGDYDASFRLRASRLTGAGCLLLVAGAVLWLVVGYRMLFTDQQVVCDDDYYRDMCLEAGPTTATLWFLVLSVPLLAAGAGLLAAGVTRTRASQHYGAMAYFEDRGR